VSLVMASTKQGKDEDLHEMLGQTVRDSDEVFRLQDATAILMGDTEENEALAAIKRYQSTNGTESLDIRYGLSFFPSDGLSAPELLSAAYRRLKSAKNREVGSVIDEG
jgi:GGDEF domain-containing protein